METIIRKLKQSKQVFVATHAHPDGDAIGALIAMGLAMEALGKKVTLYNESVIPAVYRYVPAIDRVVRHIPDEERRFDTAVVLDCGSLERIGEAAEWIHQVPVLINIDHHVTNTGFGQPRLVRPEACASSEIVYDLVKAMDLPIDTRMATAIYTGILTDTGSFRFSNTNQAAFRICEEMIGLGVDPHEVSQHVYGRFSMGRLKLLNLALNSIEISANGKLSMMSLTREMMAKTGTQPEDTAGFINYARRIQDIKVAVLIHEQKNGFQLKPEQIPYHVSLRSDGTVDVAAIAAAFGGGGHVNAAGFSIESTLRDLKSRILQLAATI
jgi:bifunctional oligoribonuclease and PAP phosphatase NrnA